MNILFIDTSNNKEITVAIEIDGKKEVLTKHSDIWKSQVVLPLVDELLRKHNLKVQDLNSIQVNEGPGSFTGLRVGAAIANTLGTYLKIPVNRKKVGEIIEPKYQ